MEIKTNRSKYGRRKTFLGNYIMQNHCFFFLKVVLLFLISGIYLKADISQKNELFSIALLAVLFVLNFLILGKKAMGLFKYMVLSTIMLLFVWSIFVRPENGLLESVGLKNAIIRLWGIFSIGQLFAASTTKFELLNSIKKHKLPIGISMFVIIMGNAFAEFIYIFKDISVGLMTRLDEPFKPIKKIFYIIQAMTFEAVYMIADAKKYFFLHGDRIKQSLSVYRSEKIENVESPVLDVTISDVKYSSQYQSMIKSAHLEAVSGDVVLITGPNGVGKTTLINILTGIIPEIYTAEYNITWNSSNIQTKSIGYVFQGVVNHVFFDSPETQLDHLSTQTRKYWLEKFHLTYTDLYTRSVSDFSSGEQQKLALISELLDPKKKIVFLDEPTAFLDNEGTETLKALIEDVRKEKIIIIVSHDKKCYRWANVTYAIDNRQVISGIWEQKYIVNCIKSKSRSDLLLTISNAKIPNGQIDIWHGELLCFTGSNGIGKTTLAYQIFHEIHKKKKTYKCGMMLQKPDRQLFQVTVWDELLMGLERSDLNCERAEKYLSLMGLHKFKNEAPQFLSGGQKRILVILCLLMQNVDVLLLDEPISSLDSASADKITELLFTEYSSRSMTLLIFDQTDSRFVKMCDNTIYLKGTSYEK